MTCSSWKGYPIAGGACMTYNVKLLIKGKSLMNKNLLIDFFPLQPKFVYGTPPQGILIMRSYGQTNFNLVPCNTPAKLKADHLGLGRTLFIMNPATQEVKRMI